MLIKRDHITTLLWDINLLDIFQKCDTVNRVQQQSTEAVPLLLRSTLICLHAGRRQCLVWRRL